MLEYRTESVASADGTTIGYRTIGQGPGIVLVQGAMGTAFNYDELARVLARAFTVHLPDRRGRGMSPLPYSPTHGIKRDIEDLDAVLKRSAATFVFGLSSGAIIALAAAAALPSITKVAIYEPPFYPKGISHRLIRRFNQEVEGDGLAAALVTASRIVKLGPWLLRFVPSRLGRIATAKILQADERAGSGQYALLRDLIPAMRYDFNVVASMDRKAEIFANLGKAVLLLGGSRSPAYLTAALTDLDAILPNSLRLEFKTLDHSSPWNTDRGGHPDPIAQALRDFFEAGPATRDAAEV